MVNYKLNPNCPMEVYNVANVVTRRGDDWKQLPHPVHIRVMDDIKKNIIMLDGKNPYENVVMPKMPGEKYPLPGEEKKEVKEKSDNGILDGNVSKVKSKIENISDREILEKILNKEKTGKNRKTIVKFIEERIWMC